MPPVQIDAPLASILRSMPKSGRDVRSKNVRPYMAATLAVQAIGDFE